MGRETARLIQLGSRSVLSMLQLEEALHRHGHHNYIVLNRGANAEASIVLGTSGIPAELVHEERARKDGVQLLKRFTGGGTVFVDQNTVFVSFIMGGIVKPNPFPGAIMKWSHDFYQDVFRKCSSSTFSLIENDFCFGNLKFGGNAQTISGQRWVHHTSFLWGVNHTAMRSYLCSPKRQPEYRAQREHGDFLCGLKDYVVGDLAVFQRAIIATLEKTFQLEQCSLNSVLHLLETDHRRLTKVLH